MKKSLLALAVLGAFAGGAVAQSSVTLYGTISQGIAKANDGTAPNAGTPAGAGNEAWTVQQGFSSRLGFRGNEDLGGGLSAQFQIEHRFLPDTGAETGGVMWNGRSYVQLTSGFGSVYMGREYMPAFWIGNKMDPFGMNTVGQFGSREAFAFYSTTPVGGIRTGNAVGYKSPKFGGLTVNVDVGAGEGGTASRSIGANVEYAAGPLYLGLGYDGASEGDRDGNNLVNFGVAYDLGFVRPMFYFGRSKIETGAPAGTHKSYLLGATAPVGPGKLKASVYRVAPDGGGDETKFAIGYDYPLSKRTFFYVDASTAKKDDVGGIDFSNRNAFDIGIQHTF